MEKPDLIYGRPWSEKEYLIVLHKYFQNIEKSRHKNADWIRQISTLLGRTPSSIVMRLENFGSIHKADGRKGLNKFGPECNNIFNAWKDKKEHLESTVDVIVKDFKSDPQLSLFDSNKVEMPIAFEKYELLDHIGDGSSGYVFSCIDTTTDEIYALKIIKSTNLNDYQIVHRFSREINILKNINHPNIIKLYDDNLESEKRYPGFIMDFAVNQLTKYITDNGVSESINDKPRITNKEAYDIILSVFNAVEALHNNEYKIIHRDINPNNILQMSDGRWILADFSIGKFISTAPVTTSFATQSNLHGWGTGHYAPVEQYRNFKNTDERTDVFAMGILIWELFSKSYPPPDMSNLMLPKLIENVVIKATKREPEARYDNIKTLRDKFVDAYRNTSEF